VTKLKNKEVVEMLREIAEYLTIKGESRFKISAYEKAAHVIENLTQPIEELDALGKLTQLPGVGKSIAEKIHEYLTTGKSSYLEELKREIPREVFELMEVPGIGPKLAMRLYTELGIRSIDELEEAAKQGRIRKMKRMRVKAEQKILKGIQIYRMDAGRVPLFTIRPLVMEMVSYLKDKTGIERISPAGSFRRWREDVGDVDILVATDSEGQKVIELFASAEWTKEVLWRGDTKCSIVTPTGVQVDLRVVPEDSWGAALQYFTGSKAHNIRLREIAISKGLKLNEYGLYREDTGQKIAGLTEEEIYEALGMPWIPPELREDMGEVQAALQGKLPDLITEDDIRGDIHMHTNYSDGADSIKAMALKAKGLGYEWIVITDHAIGLGVVGGIDYDTWKKEYEEAKQVEKEVGIRIFVGIEANIMVDGEVMISSPDMDFVIGSIHSGLDGSREKIMARYKKAIYSGLIDSVGHPTGRLLGGIRPPMDVDIDQLLSMAKDKGLFMEINAYPNRLDLNGPNVFKAKNMGIKLYIGTDSHATMQMENMIYGVHTARRGWAEKKDILNTLSSDEMEELIEKLKARRKAISV
jgi:DNA polymerase (family 10)